MRDRFGHQKPAEGLCPEYVSNSNGWGGHYCARPNEEGTEKCKRHNTVDRKRQERIAAQMKQWDFERELRRKSEAVVKQLRELNVDCIAGHPGGVHLSSEEAQKLVERLERLQR